MRKATGMQIDALEDGYVDHELFSLSSIKVCYHFTMSNTPFLFTISSSVFLALKKGIQFWFPNHDTSQATPNMGHCFSDSGFSECL